MKRLSELQAKVKKLTTNQRIKQIKPLEVYVSRDHTWICEVYRHYQKPENEAKNPYAKVYCKVFSPIVGYTVGETGDTYLCSSIMRTAILVFSESSSVGPYRREAVVKLSMVERCSSCGEPVPDIPYSEKFSSYKLVDGGMEPVPTRFKCECGGWYYYSL